MRVVVLMGGNSAERDVSLATGQGVAKALTALGHQVLALDPGTGKRLPLVEASARIGETPPAEGNASTVGAGPSTPVHLAGNSDLVESDVVFVALHGGAGEDGSLQALLDLAGVAYTGSGMLASALAMDKHRAKQVLAANGVPVAQGVLLKSREDRFAAERVGGFPLVIKPNREGSSVGVHLVSNLEDLDAALDDAFRYGEVLAEQFIPGRELTVSVLGGRALPVVEIFPEDGFYDYRHKYTKGHTRYEVPAQLDNAAARRLQSLGETAFSALGCGGVARVDFRLDPDCQPFCLEVNTIPGMTETSLVPMAAGEAGIGYPELVERLVALAHRGA